ncbi:DUF5357 family protein [Leptolyngbya cf. ectocarpi LEGE 11479]|uniref:DUF5357 family protein n=1 Tax=Leptolyngbya cf. ectocarpi LEGE 11479 TaxID=1828722 RepID=A0A928ZZU6_LEPEC|nr:DUF5357 family protein [Leptolyngbya ectocarpi]MBE9070559.1 DUF5357 family protein [Leptolyngbya cf. ectocarpi LEGE 11479]
MIDVLKESIDKIRALITPPSYLSWQTLLLLSLFSWAMATLAETQASSPFTISILSTCSWLFLTIAIWWGLTQNPVEIGYVSISPWITAAVMCVFLFQPWTSERLQLAMGMWPVVATLLVAIPKFCDWKLNWKLPKPAIRQELIVLLLINLLLSSWILFYFRIQHWFNDYPSLIAEDLDNSAFVFRFGPDTDSGSQANLLLTSASERLIEQLDDAPWPRVERWLLNLDNSINSVAEGIILNAIKERVFWSLDAPRPQSISNGYQIKLRANWLGPTAKQNGYYVEKVCTILPRTLKNRTGNETPQDSTPVAEVTCSDQTTEVERQVTLEESAT